MKTLRLDGGEWWASRTGLFAPKESTSAVHCIGGWVGPRPGLVAVVKRKYPLIAPAGNTTPGAQPVV
jgi:hypothetical protein